MAIFYSCTKKENGIISFVIFPIIVLCNIGLLLYSEDLYLYVMMTQILHYYDIALIVKLSVLRWEL